MIPCIGFVYDRLIDWSDNLDKFVELMPPEQRPYAEAMAWYEAAVKSGADSLVLEHHERRQRPPFLRLLQDAGVLSRTETRKVEPGAKHKSTFIDIERDWLPDEKTTAHELCLLLDGIFERTFKRETLII